MRVGIKVVISALLGQTYCHGLGFRIKRHLVFVAIGAHFPLGAVRRLRGRLVFAQALTLHHRAFGGGDTSAEIGEHSVCPVYYFD